MTSELETCRSQLHAKEREFDKAKTELEQVKQDLQASKDKDEKSIEDLKSRSEKQKVRVTLFDDSRLTVRTLIQADLGECRENISKLKSESKSVDDVTQEWQRKEAKWSEEKKALEAEAERMRELVKKKSAADEVSNNAEEGKIDPGRGNEAAIGNEPPKAGAGVVPAPVVVVKNTGPEAAAVAAAAAAAAGGKAKDEIGVLPET